jgi:pyrimidine operon attenuation protein/uracil phosphoribosyltransferase
MKRSTATASAGKLVLNASDVAAKVHQLTEAIAKEFGGDWAELALVGIQTRGVILAHRIAEQLKEKSGEVVPVGILDITLYRDDVHDIAAQPEVKETDLPFELEDRPIVLIDDVLFSGRTVRSAMNALIDYGRPRCIQLAVLVDRGHRELPIAADYVGVAVKTQSTDIVDVNFKEIDEEDSVRIRSPRKST